MIASQLSLSGNFLTSLAELTHSLCLSVAIASKAQTHSKAALLCVLFWQYELRKQRLTPPEPELFLTILGRGMLPRAGVSPIKRQTRTDTSGASQPGKRVCTLTAYSSELALMETASRIKTDPLKASVPGSAAWATFQTIQKSLQSAFSTPRA